MTDPLGLLVAATASAVAAGLATVTATVLAVRTFEPRYYLLLFGTLGGIVMAGVVAWTLLGSLGSTYRRGGFALIAASATVVAMLVCIPIDMVIGRPGLVGLLLLSLTAAILLARRARGLSA